MYSKMYKWILAIVFCGAVAGEGYAQEAYPQLPPQKVDSLFLPVDQLFSLGVENSLKLRADAIKEKLSAEQKQTARTSRLPDLQIGLKGGVLGQPVVFQRGLSDPTYPDTPDWSQNYAVDFTQPVYQGGRIHYGIKKAGLLQEAAALQTVADRSEIKLGLMERYLELFSLFKQEMVLERNIEESERRLEDIRRMKREGLITNNDVLRSEMQLTNDRLSLTEVHNSILLLSQQLCILLGLEEHHVLLPDTALLYQSVELRDYDAFLCEALQNEPSLNYLRKQTEIAQVDVKVARAASLPGVSLYASNTLARPVSRTMADFYNNNWNIGLSVSYSLSSLYKNNHKIRENKLAVLLSKNEEDLKLQQIRVEVRQAYLRHHEALKRVEALKLSVRQAEENYRIMQNRYLNQLAILTDLLDANSVRLDAELELTSARTQVIYTYYQLQRVCGRL